MQVTIIGGGSYQWAPTLIVDLLRTESIRPLRLVLEDIDPAPLPTMEAFAKLAAETLGTEVDVSSTTDQRQALEGADFVVVTISTGGFATMRVDLEVPARHGIRQSVGDSVGPGGINRALRNIPVLVGIGRDMEQVCPRRVDAQHHEPDDLAPREQSRTRRASRRSVSATRSATSVWILRSRGGCRTRRCVRPWWG